MWRRAARGGGGVGGVRVPFALGCPAAAVVRWRGCATTAAAATAAAPPTRIVLYDSPRSTLAAAFVAVATLKSYACAAAAAAYGARTWARVRGAMPPAHDAPWDGVATTTDDWWHATPTWLDDVVTVVSAVSGGEWRSMAVLTALAAVARATSVAAQRRMVWRLEAEVPPGQPPPMTLKQAMDDMVAGAEDAWVTAATLRQEVAAGVTPEATKHHTILITRPSPWGGVGRVERVPRSDISCAAPSTVLQSFRLQRRHGRRDENYLFPTTGWRSDHGAYLKTMLRGDYFRPDDTPPPADVDLLAIEGFGPYRPAQFADPLHPALPRLAAALHPAALPAANETEAPSAGETLPAVAPCPQYGTALVMAVTGHMVDPATAPTLPSQNAALPGTPYTVRDGTVWGEFVVPPRLSLEEARAVNRRVMMEGRTWGTVAPRPQLPAPVTLTLGEGDRASGHGAAALPPPTPRVTNEARDAPSPPTLEAPSTPGKSGP